MKRLLFLILTLAVPDLCEAMKHDDFPAPVFNITARHDDVIIHNGTHYSLFLHSDNKIYAYTEMVDPINHTRMIYVFNKLDDHTDPSTSSRSQWTQEEFKLLRTMSRKQRDIILEFKTSKTEISEGQKWLSALDLKNFYDSLWGHNIDYDDALKVVFKQGRGRLAELQAFAGIIDNAHQKLFHDIRMAKLKFYGPIALGISCVLGGLYASYRWYVGTCDETEHDEELTTEDTQTQP